MKRILSLALICALLCLTGCSPIENRLDKRLIIQGVGIDKKDGDYNITAMYMDTANPVGEGDVTSELAQGSGKSVLAALTDTVNKTGREPLYGQCGFIVLGGEIARGGIKEALEFFTDYYEFHPNIKVFCSDGSAEKIMKAENMNDRLMGDFSDAETTTGKTIVSSLSEIYADIIGGKSNAVTALVGIEEKNAVLKGAAAFDGDRQKAVLSSDECIAVQLLRGDAENVWDIFPSDDGDGINYFLSDCSSKTDISVDNGLSFHFYVSSRAGAFAVSASSKTESMIASRVKELCERSIQRLLRENHLDVFNLERCLYLYRYEKYRSLEEPKKAIALSDIRIGVDVSLL